MSIGREACSNTKYLALHHGTGKDSTSAHIAGESYESTQRQPKTGIVTTSRDMELAAKAMLMLVVLAFIFCMVDLPFAAAIVLVFEIIRQF